MAYNQQSPYGAVHGNSHRPQQRTYEAQQQYATKQNNYGTGYQGFDFGDGPVYESNEPFVHDRYGPHAGNSMQYRANMQQGRGGPGDGRGYDRGPGSSDNNSQNVEKFYTGNMRRTPPQKRPFGSEWRPNAGHRSHGSSQQYYPSSATGFELSQPSKFDEQDQRGRQHELQNPQMLQNDLPVEPNFDEEKVHEIGGGHGKSSQAQYHKPLPQPYTDRKGFNPANQDERNIADRQQQRYKVPYGQEDFHGSSGPHVRLEQVNTTYPQISHGQPSKNFHGSQAARFQKPPPRRILTNPSSPDTISWDNPFPAFGGKKETTIHKNRRDPNNSIAKLSLDDDHHHRGESAQRPQTGSSKSSQSSSFKSDKQKFPVSTTQGPTEARVGHQMEMPFAGARRSEDTRNRPSFSSNEISNIDQQRSKTMPNNISEAAQDFRPLRRHDNPSTWQEPGPTAGYHGPEVAAQTTSESVNMSYQRSTGQSRLSFGKAELTHSSEELPANGETSRPQHSAHNSLGDFYDSYYHESQHEQRAYAHDEFNQHPHSPDDEMPNFDAVPHTGHRRGNTIDFHLEPYLQQIPPNMLPASAQSQHKNPPQGPGAHIAGQFNRSRSQPNLKDQSLQGKSHQKGPFFDPLGDAPPVPPMSPLRADFGPRNITAEAQQDVRAQFRDRELKSPIDERGVPPDARSNGRAPLNQSYPRAFQDGTQSERHCLPPLQADNGRHDHIVRPESRPNQANTKESTSTPVVIRNPDALPPHPTPIRPGLMQGASSPQAAKPPPIRQYSSGSSPLHQLDVSGMSNTNRKSAPVTFEELERLKQTVKSNPSDQETQLLLAKKMVEASTVLVDDGGRIDQKTRIKNREKYLVEAHRMIKKLVSNRFIEATFYLADCYSRGLLGLEVDTKEAFNLYQTAAKSGHAQAAYRVAVCCEMGQEEGGGTRRDPSKAMQWYKRAATLGDTPATYKIGIILLKGLLGQPKNPQEALRWLKQAADKANEENPHALHELGLLYEASSTQAYVVKDDAYSRQLFTQAANFGYKFSQFRLGCAYEYGLMGCPVDPRQSIAWYSKAAVQEEHQSELALSGWYLTGCEGVLQQSDTEAYLWTRKAAQAGLAKAEYAMGYFTEVGIGAPANLEDAKRWYWRSASQNFPKARDRLEALRKGGAKMEKSRVSRSAIRKQTEGECIVM